MGYKSINLNNPFIINDIVGLYAIPSTPNSESG